MLYFNTITETRSELLCGETPWIPAILILIFDLVSYVDCILLILFLTVPLQSISGFTTTPMNFTIICDGKVLYNCNYMLITTR